MQKKPESINDELLDKKTNKAVSKLNKEIKQLKHDLDLKNKQIKDLRNTIIENEIEINRWKSTANKNERQAADYQSLVERVQETKNSFERQKKDYEIKLNEKLEKFITLILEPIEWFNNAMQTEVINDEVKNWKQGFSYIQTKINEILLAQGLESIHPEPGEDFNPNEQEAIEYIDKENIEKNKIAELTTRGFKLNNKIIKHAKVKIAK